MSENRGKRGSSTAGRGSTVGCNTNGRARFIEPGPAVRTTDNEGRTMMDGMIGMGAGMLIWGIVGILLIVLLVVLIAKLLKR
jgi:hypothetical protein